MATARTQVTQLTDQDRELKQEVQQLQVYERQYTEFNQEMNALHKQLETLQAIVPQDKQTDDFIRMLQGAASASGVQIRKLTADAIIPHDYHFEDGALHVGDTPGHGVEIEELADGNAQETEEAEMEHGLRRAGRVPLDEAVPRECPQVVAACRG